MKGLTSILLWLFWEASRWSPVNKQDKTNWVNGSRSLFLDSPQIKNGFSRVVKKQTKHNKEDIWYRPYVAGKGWNISYLALYRKSLLASGLEVQILANCVPLHCNLLWGQNHVLWSALPPPSPSSEGTTSTQRRTPSSSPQHPTFLTDVLGKYHTQHKVSSKWKAYDVMLTAFKRIISFLFKS